ncbi:phosphatidate cytidylyltransferase [Putridiphycobacter roseus]|uniref:Phosphatidate cytidylyltransferase n=1 Tax=Putridiphycobacter roseus TaxID=2219161 RepID=A0A2W1MZP1_9FLAO|nr:phosphatidate cytidylyltransferase [Putridiphycobacter roseus]PZE16864.1 phosphatidate cytidylyltransferase [Putridiphycobacter roseus]
MLQRAIWGGVFVAILLTGILLGDLYFHILFGVITIISLNEFYSLFKKQAVKPNYGPGIIFGTLFYFLGSWALAFEFWSIYLVALLILSFPLLALFELYRKKKRPFENIGVTVLGWFYISLPMILLNDLMWDGDLQSWSNFLPVLSLFILVWTSDTFAYLIGKSIGKHKLFERISPNKSWEGFFGGLLFAVIAGIIIAYAFEVSILKYAILGVVIATFGTLGDLIESMLKRSVNVKDSGNVIPGHGGILDRIDAVLFVIPLVYLLFQLV